MARSQSDYWGLMVEAERMVREGYARAEVSRLLGIPAQTLAAWALRDGWRRKDIEFERREARMETMVKTINSARARVNEERAIRAARWRMLLDAVDRAAGGELRLGEAGTGAGTPRLDRVLAVLEAMPVEDLPEAPPPIVPPPDEPDEPDTGE